MKNTSISWSIILGLITLSLHLTINADEYDPSASVFLFQKQMAKRGNAESQFKLGLMYETGSGVNTSIALATSWYKKAAKQSYKPASNRLTYLEIKKTGFKDNHEKWLKQLKADARFNEGEALFLLGQMYSEGTGVNKSLSRSLKYLRKAAGGNIPGSEAEIARVEEELSLLQDQYITEDKNKMAISAIAVTKIAPPIVKPPVVKPTRVKPVTVKTAVITKKTRPEVATVKKISPKPTPVKTNSARNTVAVKKQPAKKIVKKTTASNNIKMAKTSKKKAAVINKPPAIIIAKEEETHPMDTICGGRNRFSRGCR